MRFKYNKEIEFFFKKYLFPQHLLLKRRIERSIRKKDENEIKQSIEIIRTNYAKKTKWK